MVCRPTEKVIEVTHEIIFKSIKAAYNQNPTLKRGATLEAQKDGFASPLCVQSSLQRTDHGSSTTDGVAGHPRGRNASGHH